MAGFGPDGTAPGGLAFDVLGQLHFASITVFDRPFLDPLLVIECNFDGELGAFVGAFARTAPGLQAVLNCRIGPPLRSQADVAQALHAAARRPAAGHIGAHDLTRSEIVASEALAGSIRQHLVARQAQFQAMTAVQAADDLRRNFAAQCPPLATRRPGLKLALALALAVLALAFALVIAPLLIIGALVFLRAERREPVRVRPEARIDSAARNENRLGSAQNHFSSIAPLKAGPVRWASLWLAMGAVNLLARLVFTQGKLGEIPSIHFAHWVVVDEGSSLIFVSNYGGTWESYLDDFIQKAASGLTAVWSHCQGFPKSRWLASGGARDERAFKRYARDTQAAESIWYSAYPALTTRRIINNRAIMEALIGLSKEPPERWLARI